jgi:hypothetical protein
VVPADRDVPAVDGAFALENDDAASDVEVRPEG